MKYYTTTEQSKKLVELGINVDTADMSYNKFIDEDDSEYEIHCNKLPKLRALYTDYLPCWSTEALLDILDETIVTDNDDEYKLNFGKDGTSYYMFYEDIYKLKDSVIDELDFSCSTLLNCAFEMIVKLKELKLI